MKPQQPSLWRIKGTAGQAAGEIRDLQEGSILICGRAAGSDLTIADPQVSGRHLQFTVRHGRLELEDLGSTNGTLLHGARVQNAHLSDGDLIRLGGAELQVTFLPQSPALPPPIPIPEAAHSPIPPARPVGSPPPIPAAAVGAHAPAAIPAALPGPHMARPLVWVGLGLVGLIVALGVAGFLTNTVLLGGSGRWDLMGSVVRSTISNGWNGRLRPQTLPIHNTRAIDVRPDPAVRITAPAGALDVDREFVVRRIDIDTLPAEEPFDSFSFAVPLAAFDIDADMEPDDLFVQPVRFTFDLDELDVAESLRENLELVRYDSSGKREVLVIERDGRWLSCDVRHNAVIQLLAVFTSLVPVLAAKDQYKKWGGVGAMLGKDYGVLITDQFQIWYPHRKMPLRETPDYLEVKRILEEKKRYYFHEMHQQVPNRPPITYLDRIAMYVADKAVIRAGARLRDRDFLVKNVLPYPVVHSLGALDRAGEYLWKHRKFRRPGNKIDVILPVSYTGGTAYGFSGDGHFTYPYIHLKTNAIPTLPPGTADARALDELDTTVVHELFHVVQKEYFNWSKYLSPGQIWSGNRYIWFVEATALVLEEDAEPFYRSKGWTRQHFGKTFFAKTHMGWYKLPLDTPLSDESKAQAMGYGASRFLLALRDRYYPSNSDAFLKRYLETFGTFSSPVQALSEVTSRSALVLGADFQLFCARHVDEIVNGMVPAKVKYTLSTTRPVARWPLEAAPLSSAIGIFDYSAIDKEQLGKAVLAIRTDVADDVWITTRHTQTKSKGWRTVDERFPAVPTETNGKELTVQRIDPSPGEWYSRSIASWFEEARTTVTLVEKPDKPPKVELLEDEGAVRLEFPESPLEASGELLRREARIAFPNTKEVTIAFTEGRGGDVAWRQIAREGNARALKGMDPRISRVFLPQDLDDMLAVWSAFRGVLGGESLNLEIRYRLVVKRREIDTVESTGVDGPWSEVFTVPIKAPMPDGHPGDVSGSWTGQVMLVHKPIRLDLSMDGLDIRGTMVFGGNISRLEGRWVPEEFGWEIFLFSTDPDDPGGSFIVPYLRALPDGGLWLAAPPSVLRRPEEKTEDEPAGWWRRWFGS